MDKASKGISIHVRGVPTKLWAQAKRRAITDQTTLQDIVVKALNKYLSRGE